MAPPGQWKGLRALTPPKILIRLHRAIQTGQTVNLERSQWWSYERLRDFQNRRLRIIVRYAYAEIPAYRRLFDAAGLIPDDIRTVEDLPKLPITRREEMQENTAFVKRARIVNTLYTGGSTGTSLRYFESRASAVVRWNAHLRGWRWNGFEYGRDREAVIASAQGVIGEDRLTLTLTGDMAPASLERSVARLNAFQPQHLRGYVSSLYLLARYCQARDIVFPSLRSINPISENLYDFQRETLEQAFQCPVFEEYCCNDGGACAWECDAHQGLHSCMERAIIEELDGEMIVTDLWNRAMPFIRYRNGDSVTFLRNQCPCGRQLPLIRVRGRTNDIIITPAGPLAATYLMFHGINYNDPKRFRSGFQAVQYVQKPGYCLEIYAVLNEWCTRDDVAAFLSDVRAVATGMQVNLHEVADLPASPKGKRQFIRNEDRELLRQWGLPS